MMNFFGAFLALELPDMLVMMKMTGGFPWTFNIITRKVSCISGQGVIRGKEISLFFLGKQTKGSYKKAYQETFKLPNRKAKIHRSILFDHG